MYLLHKKMCLTFSVCIEMCGLKNLFAIANNHNINTSTSIIDTFSDDTLKK